MDPDTISTLVKHRYPCIIVDGRGSIDVAFSGARELAEKLTDARNIEIIEPEKDKKSISIDQARLLRKKVTLKSHYGSHRVFIIKKIASMGSDAQNTLLKTLEELGDYITIVIAAERVEDALPTIRSRSRIVTTTNSLNKFSNRKQYLIDSAILGQVNYTNITETDLTQATKFLRYPVADRLAQYKDKADNRESIMTLLISLHVVCISTMRETTQHSAKIAWSKKVSIVNDLLEKANSTASGKLLLLGAATRL